MLLVDILDREFARFERDFRDCAVTMDPTERHRRGRALAQRVAAYLLALEQVMKHAALRGLGEPALQALRDEQGRLKWRVADALLAYCASEERAYRSLCKTHRQLRSHAKRLDDELLGRLEGVLSANAQRLVGETMLQALQSNRRPSPAWQTLPVYRRRASRQGLPVGFDPARLPVLRQVVLLPGIGASAG